MKVTTPLLAAAIATAFMALHVPEVSAQRNNGTFVGAPQNASRPQRTTPAPGSTSPVIGPMGNPIAPMANPVAPVISPAFMRFSDPVPTVVVPEQFSDSRQGRRNRGRDGRDVIYVPVGVPAYYYPPAYYDYPEAGLTPPPTIPGQLPGVRYNYEAPANFTTSNVPAPNQAAGTFDNTPQTEVYSEPRMIINEPRPNRVVTPPAVGTPRSDVIGLFGRPWGTIQSRGQETLYFDGLTVVFGADGRVLSAR